MPVSRRTANRTAPRPTLVGEQNPYGDDPHFALYPAPAGCAGDRLCRLVLGMRRAAYLREFDRVNLCDGPWSERDAWDRAERLLGEAGAGDRRLILLGAKVCGAFGVPYRPFQQVDGMLCLPHPSGRSRAWNAPDAFERGRVAVAQFVLAVAPLLGAADGEEAEA